MSSTARIDTGNYVEVNILNCGHLVTCLYYHLNTVGCPYCGIQIVKGTRVTFTDYNTENIRYTTKNSGTQETPQESNKNKQTKPPSSQRTSSEKDEI